MGEAGPALAVELGPLQVAQDLLGAHDDTRRQAREAGHLDPERAVRAAGLDLAQEHDAVLPLAGRDVDVADARDVGGQVDELVVVGREEGLGRGGALRQVLGHRPGDREAVEGGGAAADLVEQHQAALAGVAQDVGGLLHLDHERRLAAQDLVARADAREDAVDEPELGLARRHEAAHLRHERDERHLAQEGGLAAHVRAGQHEEPRRAVAHRQVVRDERLAQHPLHDRVAALAVDELVAPREARLHVVEARRRLGERGEHVELGGGARGLLDAPRGGRQALAQLLEQALLAGRDQLVRAQHAVLVLLELGRDEALAAGDRLLAHVVGRHQRQVRAADLDVVAEDAVEADLERGDPGARPLALLDRRDRLAPAPARVPQLVELRVDAVAHEAALAHERGRVGHERPLDVRGEVERRVELLEAAPHQRGQALAERLRGRGQGLERRAERHQVARAGRAERDPAEDAVEVLDARERVAQPPAVERAEGQLLDGVEPVLDALHLDERAQDPVAQRPAAHRGLRVVEHVHERAAPAAVGEALDELEVAARERVDREHVLRACA